MAAEKITQENMHIHLQYLIEKVDKLDKKIDDLDKIFVSRHEYEPIKKIVYGVVLLLFAGAVTLVTGALL